MELEKFNSFFLVFIGVVECSLNLSFFFAGKGQGVESELEKLSFRLDKDVEVILLFEQIDMERDETLEPMDPKLELALRFIPV